MGYGILAWKLRIDPRVIVFERTNVRYFDAAKLPFLADFTVTDVSFISIKTVFPKLLEMTRPKGELLILFKPQFELAKNEVEKKGIIRSKELHIESLKRISYFISGLKLKVEGFTFSKIKGAKGNIEFWIYLKNDFIEEGSKNKKTEDNYVKIIRKVVNTAHDHFK